MLEDKFGIPAFINNDGDLFVYGEAIAGFLPYVNGLLEQAGSPKRYQNLFGVTLGTGLGGGIVRDGELFIGDNSAGGEVWLLRNKLDPTVTPRKAPAFAPSAGPMPKWPACPWIRRRSPRRSTRSARAPQPGHRPAALEAFRRLGEVAGDAMAQALTLVDGLAVIGGGVSGASQLFLPALVDAINDVYVKSGGLRQRRLIARAFNVEDAAQREAFLKGDAWRWSCREARGQSITTRCSGSRWACRAWAPARPCPSEPMPTPCTSWTSAEPALGWSPRRLDGVS